MKRYPPSFYSELERQSFERQVASVTRGGQSREQIITQLWLRGLGDIASDETTPTAVLQHKLQCDRRKALGRRRRLTAAAKKVRSRTTSDKQVAYYLVSELMKTAKVPAKA